MRTLLFTILLLCFNYIVSGQCTASITASSHTICSGSTATLIAIPSMTSAVTYTWSNASHTQSTIVNQQTSTTYTVWIESYGAGSCIATQTIDITVIPTPTIQLISGQNLIGCQNAVSSFSFQGAITYTLLPSQLVSTGVFPIIPVASTIYTVTGTLPNGCVSLFPPQTYTFTLSTYSSPTITAYSSNPICNGIPTTSIICSGANTYTLYPSGVTGNGIFTINQSGVTTWTVYGTDSNGCLNDATVSVYAAPNPTLVIAPSSTVCIGSTATITVSAFGGTPVYSYTWSSAQFGSTATLNTSVTITQSVVASDVNGCQTAIETHTIFVDNSCQDVWPGDANSDGIADNTDVLELGLHYTQTGAARTSTNNAWQSFHSSNWAGIITNGKNLNHSDCNGDGIINNDDTLAIYNNYGLIHTFKLSQVQSTNPALNIVPDQTMVDKGKWGTASIYLGDATNTINNVNGVAYTLSYDNSLIEQDSIYLTYQNSFIDAGQNLHFRKTDFTTSALFTANTHTNNTNVNGYGKIATLHYKIRPDLSTDSPLNLAITQAVVSNASGSITPVTSGSSTVIAIGASVGIKDYTTNSNLLMYPNPTSEMLNVELEASTSRTSVSAVICIYNALGALVLKENITSNASTSLSNRQTTINTANFAKGLYVVELQSNNQVLHRAKLVKE